MHTILEYIENLCKFQGIASPASMKFNITISLAVVSGVVLSLHRPEVLRNSELSMFSSIFLFSLDHFSWSWGSFNHSGPSYHFNSRNFLASGK